MTIGRTNSGSGGGLSANSAVLAVTAFVGSSVTISKSGTSKTKDATKAHIIDADNDKAIYIFSIGSSQFGTWSVAVTSDGITQTKTVTIDSNELYEVEVRARVPDEYQEVEYLQSSGSQRIDTGVASVNGLDIKFKYNSTTNNTSIYGARSSQSGTDRYFFDIYSGNFLPYPSPSSASNLGSANTNEHTLKTGEAFNGHLYYDGSDKGTVNTTYTSPLSLYLFAEHWASSLQASSSRIYYAKLYKGNSLERDYYPCYRKSDSVAGLYDRLNKVFYTNSGSGSFAVGADV